MIQRLSPETVRYPGPAHVVALSYKLTLIEFPDANGYYGAWPGWAVSVSVLPLTTSY